MVDITYRTSGPWGNGKGGNLSGAEIDENFYGLVQALATIGDSDSISDIQVVNNAITIVTVKGRIFGPFSLPKAIFRPRGDWAASTAYAVNDVVGVEGDGLYFVAIGHTSAATFDASRTVSGDKVYWKIIDQLVGAQGPKGDTWQGPDAFGTYSGLSAHDSEAAGFSYYSSDGDGGNTTSLGVIFFKNSATAGDWSMTKWEGNGGAANLTLQAWIPGTYANGQKIYRFLTTQGFYIRVGFPDALAILDVAPTADCSFSVMVGGLQIGTIDFTAGNTIGTFNGLTQEAAVYYSVATEIVAPATADATAAGLTFSIPTASTPSSGGGPVVQ